MRTWIAFIRAAKFALLISAFSSAARAAEPLAAAGGIRFLKQAKAGECFPANPQSKQYLEIRKKLPSGEWKRFACDFACVSSTGEIETVRGTQIDSYRWKDDGRKFVCRGYKMEFQETPMSPDSWGFYAIEGIEPFKAKGSGIPELEAWADSEGIR